MSDFFAYRFIKYFNYADSESEARFNFLLYEKKFLSTKAIFISKKT